MDFAGWMSGFWVRAVRWNGGKTQLGSYLGGFWRKFWEEKRAIERVTSITNKQKDIIYRKSSSYSSSVMF
jgi:hypothetical protein